jgi:hypothetical protein
MNKRDSIRTWLAALLLALPLAATASMFPKLDQLEQSLQLSAAQKTQFDVAVAATQRAAIATGMLGMRLKAQVRDELAKPRPDLAAIAAAREEIAEQTKPARHAARDEWLKLYAMLSDAQVAIVITRIEDLLDKLDALREHGYRLLLGRMGAS